MCPKRLSSPMVGGLERQMANHIDRLNYLEAALSRLDGLVSDASLHIEGANRELVWRLENIATTLKHIRLGTQNLEDELADANPRFVVA